METVYDFCVLNKKGDKVNLDEREFHCRGSFSLLHRGHPNDVDLLKLKEFAESLHLK